MPLFVPILRLLMLFLNVYDSYKTLKEPQSSSRNGGRPSVRAMSQRKRDMKGCLAVWVVWVRFNCQIDRLILTRTQAVLSIYERLLESVISLFIPFYDEFKSLALLFLILTRARVGGNILSLLNHVLTKLFRERNLYIFILFDPSLNRTLALSMPFSTFCSWLAISSLPSQHIQCA